MQRTKCKTVASQVSIPRFTAQLSFLVRMLCNVVQPMLLSENSTYHDDGDVRNGGEVGDETVCEFFMWDNVLFQ